MLFSRSILSNCATRASRLEIIFFGEYLVPLPVSWAVMAGLSQNMMVYFLKSPSALYSQVKLEVEQLAQGSMPSHCTDICVMSKRYFSKVMNVSPMVKLTLTLRRLQFRHAVVTCLAGAIFASLVDIFAARPGSRVVRGTVSVRHQKYRWIYGRRCYPGVTEQESGGRNM